MMLSAYGYPSNLEASEQLVEETMINPKSPIPSFLEMTLMDATFTAGQNAIKSTLEALISYLSNNNTDNNTSTSRSNNTNNNATNMPQSIDPTSAATTNNTGGRISELKRRVLRFLSNHPLEIQAIVTYFMERQCLSSKTSFGGTVAESVYGAMRSKVIPVSQNIHNNANGSYNSGHSNDTHKHSRMALRSITEKDCIRTAFLLAFAPYMKNKFDHIYQEMKNTRNEIDPYHPDFTSIPTTNNSNNNNSTNSSNAHKLHHLFYTLYPYLHMTHEGVIVYYQLSYLLGRSIYYSPSLAFLKLIIRRVTIADREDRSSNSKMSRSKENSKEKSTSMISGMSGGNSSSNDSSTVLGDVKNVRSANHSKHGKTKSMRFIAQKVALIGITSMYLGACFMKLRQERKRLKRYYRLLSLQQQRNALNHNSSDNLTTSISERRRNNDVSSTIPFQRQLSSQQQEISDTSHNIPLPPPPKPSPPLPYQQQSTSTIRSIQSHKCPLCHENHVNPAASTSGYVFCYRCLVQYIRDNEKEECPITGKVCREMDIITIFEST